jgi:hypothetical protein
MLVAGPVAGRVRRQEALMPGFLRKAAGSAAVAGAVTAVGRRMQRRQADQAGAASQAEPVREPPQAVPAPRPAPSTTDVVDQLRAPGQLRTDGLLTDDEFAAQKAKILAG